MISQRLLCCANMISPGARVADIGADHGYLGIYLLGAGIAQYVAACDLRDGPLQSARRNAARYHVGERMDFILSDGLHHISPDSIDTVVCAGMGGDLIIKILSEAPWLKNSRYTLILQPQAGIAELRAWLGEQGFFEEKADLACDSGFLYCVCRVRYGKSMTLTPGQQFVSPALLASGSPLLEDYITRLKCTLGRIAEGLSRADAYPDPVRLAYYHAALQELGELEVSYAHGKANIGSLPISRAEG